MLNYFMMRHICLAGFTGFVLALLMILLFVFAVPYARAKVYRAFWFTHNLYVLVFFFTVNMHFYLFLISRDSLFSSESKSDVVSGWNHREPNLMFTIATTKIKEDISLSHSLRVNNLTPVR